MITDIVIDFLEQLGVALAAGSVIKIASLPKKKKLKFSVLGSVEI